MAVDKAPGRDGFSMAFPKNAGYSQGDILDLLWEFHLNGKLSRGLNSTFITRIPKKIAANHIQDFIPLASSRLPAR